MNRLLSYTLIVYLLSVICACGGGVVYEFQFLVNLMGSQ